MLIEWLRVAYRQGWLGDGGRQTEVVETLSGRVLGAIKRRRARLHAARPKRATAAAVAAGPPVAAAPAGTPPANAPPDALRPIQGDAPF